MRIQIVECKWHGTAQRRCPWARKIAKVENGWMCFESLEDYHAWKKNK